MNTHKEDTKDVGGKRVLPHVVPGASADAIGATLMALLLLCLLAGFLWLFGLTGGRYVLTIVLGVAGLIVWGWWKLISSKPSADE